MTLLRAALSLCPVKALGIEPKQKKTTRVKKCFYIRPPARLACVCALAVISVSDQWDQVIGVWPTLTGGKEREKLPLQKKRGFVTPARAFSHSKHWFISPLLIFFVRYKKKQRLQVSNFTSMMSHWWGNLRVLSRHSNAEQKTAHLCALEAGIRFVESDGCLFGRKTHTQMWRNLIYLFHPCPPV